MEQKTNKPVRPAPPPPMKKTNELPNSKKPSLEEILNGPVNGTDIIVLNQEATNEDDNDDFDEEDEEEMNNYTVPQIPAPNLPPPSIPAPTAPIEKQLPKVPSTMPPLPPPPIPRRTVPAIPPRNN